MRCNMLALLIVCACNHREPPPPAVDAAVTPGPCNGDTCTANEFCYIQLVGAILTAPDVGCNPLPSTCVATPTCGCVVPTVPSCGGQTPSCELTNGIVNITCALP